MGSAAAHPARVVVFGAAHEDLMLVVEELPRAGETVLSRRRHTGCGGKGANQATAAAAAGARTSLVGVLGTDERGQRVRRNLVRAGVDTALTQTAEDVATGVAVVIVDRRGANQIVVDVGASAALTTAQIDEAIAACGPQDVVVTQCEIPFHLVEHVIASAAARDLRVVVNLAPYVPLDVAVLRQAWLLVLNEHEAEAAVGRSCVKDLAQACAAALSTACLVTLGSRGSVAAVPGGQSFSAEAVQVSDVVDTTGAGDVYVGTLAAALAEGDRSYRALAAAMTRASAAAAASVSRQGAQDQPSSPRRTAASTPA